MDIISRFDHANAQKAHGDTILAGAVLPDGLHSPFDHAWGYLNGPGAMEPHIHHKGCKRCHSKQRKQTHRGLCT